MINYQEIQQKLEQSGWFVKSQKIQENSGNRSEIKDVKQLIQIFLNVDLREIQEPDIKGKLDTLDKDIVMQIQKIRNISAPKDNPESKTAPRLFKFQVTDGQSLYSAIEAETIQSITLNTVPGTKILLKLKSSSVETHNGQLMLKPSNVTVLGGHVEALAEKYELAKSLAKYTKGGRVGGTNGGPPPFIAFGEKIQQTASITNDRSFKSLQNNVVKESENENSEFNSQRNDAIAEAYKSGTKKTFGGGTQKMVDSNVQKIMEKGYTEEQANHSLRIARNNLDRALSNLKRQDEKKAMMQNSTKSDYEPKSSGRDGRDGKRGSRAGANADPTSSSKPSAKVSLFEFLEDKLPQQENEISTAKNYNNTGSSTSYTNNNNNSSSTSSKYASTKSSFSSSQQPSSNSNERFENNISSSFRHKSDNGSGKENSFHGNKPASGKYQQQLPNSSSSNAPTNSSTVNISSSAGYNKSSQSRQPHSSSSSRDHPSSKYQSHHNGYQSGSNNSAPPYRQNSYQDRQESSRPKSNYSSNQQYQKQGSPPQQYSSSQKYNQSQTQSASSYQKGKPSSNYNSKYDSKYEQPKYEKYDKYEKYEKYDKYDQKYDSKYEQSYNSNRNNDRYNSSSSQSYNATSKSNYNSSGGNSKYYENNKSESQNPKNPNQQNSQSYGANSSSNNSRRTPNVESSMAKLSINTSKPTSNPPNNNKPYNPSGGAAPNKSSYNRESQPQQIQQSQSNVETGAVKSPFGNEFGGNVKFNPFAIVGFQNKETNEYAKNVLKSQQQTQQVQSAPVPEKPKMSHAPIFPHAVQIPTTTSVKQTPPQQAPQVSVAQPNPPKLTPVFPHAVPIQIPVQTAAPPTPKTFSENAPPPFVQNHTVMQQVLPVLPAQGPTTVYHSNMSYPPTIMMQQAPPMAAQPGVSYINGKIGDYVMAKYWEDGQFYNAKITGVSENTYVVLFTEYGNHEEVRKSDCLPVTVSIAPIPAASPHPPTYTYTQQNFHPTIQSFQPASHDNKMPYQAMKQQQMTYQHRANGNGKIHHRYK